MNLVETSTSTTEWASKRAGNSTACSSIPDELRAAQTGFDLWEQHQRLLLEITQLYFEHRRCALESMSTPNDALAELERALLRREIEGKLLALTGIEWPSAPP